MSSHSGKVGKYDWLLAVAWCPELKRQTLAVRLAIVICDFFNEEKGIAWPSRQTLAQKIGAHVSTVSKGIRCLKEIGALFVRRQHAVSGGPSKSKDRRSNCYVLDIEWAAKHLANRDGQENRSNAQPKSLRAGCKSEVKHANVALTATQLGSDERDTNTLSANIRRMGRDEMTKGVYARESPTRIKALQPVEVDVRRSSDTSRSSPWEEGGPFAATTRAQKGNRL